MAGPLVADSPHAARRQALATTAIHLRIGTWRRARLGVVDMVSSSSAVGAVGAVGAVKRSVGVVVVGEARREAGGVDGGQLGQQ